ncbi:MAG: carboxypeptidase regulatory-like domain-containing protein [Chloroflexi bacterium]|nr:carboxypeptidase regulatory-like domain-containing protein [Chloroflexota bacterium]
MKQADGITPIASAAVYGYSLNSRWYTVAYTNSDGYYESIALQGPFIVSAHAPGFALEYYNDRTSSITADALNVTANSDMPNINFFLGAPAPISGTVFAEDGTTPIESTSIEAVEVMSGQVLGSAATDSSGVYVLDSLPTGSYRLRAYRYGWVWEYYDGHYDAVASTLVEASADAITPNIDFTLTSGVFITGTAGLEGHSNSTWKLPLTVTFTREDGGELPTHYTLYTSLHGVFSLYALPPGEYRIRAKQIHTLANAVTVTLHAGDNIVDLGTLREGDANNDNVVNISDFSLLAAAFGREFWHPEFDARADFNDDNIVNIADFSLLATNFGQVGAP